MIMFANLGVVTLLNRDDACASGNSCSVMAQQAGRYAFCMSPVVPEKGFALYRILKMTQQSNLFGNTTSLQFSQGNEAIHRPTVHARRPPPTETPATFFWSTTMLVGEPEHRLAAAAP